MLDIIGLFTFWMGKEPKGTWGGMNESYGEYSIYYVMIISNNNNSYKLFPKKMSCQMYKNTIFKNILANVSIIVGNSHTYF